MGTKKEMKPYSSSGKGNIEVYKALAGLNPEYCIQFWSIMLTKIKIKSDSYFCNICKKLS